MRRKRIAEIENYVKSLEEIAEKRRKMVPKIPRTVFEGHAEGYVDALETVIKDLKRILE